MLTRLRVLPTFSLIPLVALGLLLAGPRAAVASCMAPPPIEEALETADIVFVGTVKEIGEGNRWASVTVEEIWRGPDLEATVVVKGGPPGNAMTSVDRFFEVGVRYLFFPYVDVEQGGLADNSCTSTQPFTEETARLRPVDFRRPADEAAPTSQTLQLDDLMPFVLVGVVFVVLLGIGLVARGRAEA